MHSKVCQCKTANQYDSPSGICHAEPQQPGPHMSREHRSLSRTCHSAIPHTPMQKVHEVTVYESRDSPACDEALDHVRHVSRETVILLVRRVVEKAHAHIFGVAGHVEHLSYIGTISSFAIRATINDRVRVGANVSVTEAEIVLPGSRRIELYPKR